MRPTSVPADFLLRRPSLKRCQEAGFSRRNTPPGPCLSPLETGPPIMAGRVALVRRHLEIASRMALSRWGPPPYVRLHRRAHARTRSAAEQLNAASGRGPWRPHRRRWRPHTRAAATDRDADRRPTPPRLPPPSKRNARATSSRAHRRPRLTAVKTPVPVATPVVVEPPPTPTPVPPAVPKWNDGSYSGWGRSRHGDIQATLAIENAQIALRRDFDLRARTRAT